MFHALVEARRCFTLKWRLNFLVPREITLVKMHMEPN
jgi:hypothetical protein